MRFGLITSSDEKSEHPPVIKYYSGRSCNVWYSPRKPSKPYRSIEMRSIMNSLHKPYGSKSRACDILVPSGSKRKRSRSGNGSVGVKRPRSRSRSGSVGVKKPRSGSQLKSHKTQSIRKYDIPTRLINAAIASGQLLKNPTKKDVVEIVAKTISSKSKETVPIVAKLIHNTGHVSAKGHGHAGHAGHGKGHGHGHAGHGHASGSVASKIIHKLSKENPTTAVKILDGIVKPQLSPKEIIKLNSIKKVSGPTAALTAVANVAAEIVQKNPTSAIKMAKEIHNSKKASELTAKVIVDAAAAPAAGVAGKKKEGAAAKRKKQVDQEAAAKTTNELLLKAIVKSRTPIIEEEHVSFGQNLSPQKKRKMSKKIEIKAKELSQALEKQQELVKSLPKSLKESIVKGDPVPPVSDAKVDAEKLQSSKKGAIINLQPHQLALVEKFFHSSNGILADYATGSGKTYCAIASVVKELETLRVTKPDLFKDIQILVITPASVIKQFEDNVRDTGGFTGITGVTLNGKEGENVVTLAEDIKKKFYFTHYRSLAWKKQGGTNRFGIKNTSWKNVLMILDEAHELRNSENESSIASKIKHAVMQSYKRLLMTATPAYNTPLDYVYLLNMVIPESRQIPYKTDQELADAFKNKEKSEALKQTFETYSITYKPKSKVENEEDVNKYPTIGVEEVVKIKMDPIQEEFLRKLTKKDDAFYSQSRIINDWPKNEITNRHPTSVSPKVKKLIDLLSLPKYTTGMKHVIHTEFVLKGKGIPNDQKEDENAESGWLTYIKNHLEQDPILQGKKIVVDMILSSASAENRQKVVKAFNKKESNKTKVLIITRTGSTGIDLKGVRSLHILEPNFSPSYTDQVRGRAVRYESHKNYDYNIVDIYHYIMCPYKKGGKQIDSSDQEIYDIMTNKREISKIFSDWLVNTGHYKQFIVNSTLFKKIGKTVKKGKGKGKPVKKGKRKRRRSSYSDSF